MSVLDFVLCFILIGALFYGFYIFPIRNSPKGINEKKIKVKHFAFLFHIEKEYNFGYLPKTGEKSKDQKEKQYKEVPIKLFVCLLIGYIINFWACIAVIICFCLNIDITKYVAVGAIAEFILLFFFAVIM